MAATVPTYPDGTRPRKPGCEISLPQLWTQWQREVLEVLRREFQEVLGAICLEDVDWVAWREFYDQGRTPLSAVNRALERDL